MSSETVLYMVIPCYNEQEVLPDSAEKLRNKISDLITRKKISKNSKICFVNDGSRDRTWAIIRELCQRDLVYSGICLAHNEGHQNAVLAGLMTVQPYCDAAISMDADLQDDIDAIDAMIDKYDEGCNIVYGVRDNRETDTFFKRVTAEGFYRFMKMMGADVIFNHADFRLMDKQALAAFGDYQEVNLFLRGIVPMIGLKHDCVYYKRKERLAGDYFPVVQTYQIYCRFGTGHIGNQRAGIDLVIVPAFYRTDNCRLDQSDYFPVAAGRTDSAGCRYHRRVRGEDLSGSETPPPVSGTGVYRRQHKRGKIKKDFLRRNRQIFILRYRKSFQTKNGAGDGNRTHNISLEGWSFTTKLHPHINFGQPKSTKYNT